MKKIIIVDDDPAIADAIQMVFDCTLFDVTVYKNATVILNNIYEPPDLFILDKQLSGVDGLDVCRQLKSQETTRHIPVIMLSASQHLERITRDAGADDFIEKPFPIDVLRGMVAKYTS